MRILVQIRTQNLFEELHDAYLFLSEIMYSSMLQGFIVFGDTD